MTEILAGVGFLALVLLVCVVGAVSIAGMVDWRRDREMRRWPDNGEWWALEEAAIAASRDADMATRRHPAYRAYRKLRYKYGKRTGR